MKTERTSKKKHEISASNLIRHELIGLRAKVVNSLNDIFIGISGTIIDESRNMFKIKCEDNVIKMVPKEACIFEFELPNGDKVRADGRMLNGRSEERIKMKRRKIVWPLTVEKQFKKAKFRPVVCEVLPLDP
ncbi:MAG: ribonuclease P protein subunit [Candidatus Freyarchaeota archaeon]|nr:ribonuclease P protein subunit [Candidatus Jordarchaeia archaeon]